MVLIPIWYQRSFDLSAPDQNEATKSLWYGNQALHDPFS